MDRCGLCVPETNSRASPQLDGFLGAAPASVQRNEAMPALDRTICYRERPIRLIQWFYGNALWLKSFYEGKDWGNSVVRWSVVLSDAWLQMHMKKRSASQL